MAPSVISMMAWLHRLPWPSAAAWEAQSNFIFKAGYPVKTQQVSRLFLRGTNLIQDLERFLHCILYFAFSFYMKLVNQELKVLQRDAQQTKTQALDDQHNHPSAKWTDKKYSKDRKAESECWENKGVRRGWGGIIPGSLAHWQMTATSLQHWKVIRINRNAHADTHTHTLRHVAVLLLGPTIMSASWDS